jgi:hypothetical protein
VLASVASSNDRNSTKSMSAFYKIRDANVLHKPAGHNGSAVKVFLILSYFFLKCRITL